PVELAAPFCSVRAVGAVGINVNELYRPRQIEFVLTHSRARVLLVDRDLLTRFPRPLVPDAQVINLDEIGGVETDFAPLEISGDEPAQITYTSGSTGQPKGVLMSHANLWAGVRVVTGYLGLQGHDRIASLLPFSFVYGFNQLTTSLYVGATLVVERSTLIQEIAATMRRERVTVLAAVPPLWQRLVGVEAVRGSPIHSLRIVTTAGGRLRPEC